MEMIGKRVRFPKLKEYLDECRVKRFNRMHRVTSDEEWAGEIGVSPTSFSEWRRGIRKPEGANLEMLAAHEDIGRRIYDALGMLRPSVENDPLLMDILQHLDELPHDQQEAFAKEIRQQAEDNRKKKPKLGGLPGVD